MGAIEVLSDRGVQRAKDGIPIKGELPIDIERRFRTLAQWRRAGFEPVVGAVPVPMHPNCYLSHPVEYYFEEDCRRRVC